MIGSAYVEVDPGSRSRSSRRKDLPCEHGIDLGVSQLPYGQRSLPELGLIRPDEKAWQTLDFFPS